jgi:HSP20 family protein
MHTIIHPNPPVSRTTSARAHRTAPFRMPLYQCDDLGDTLKLVVYLPGVEAPGVNVEARGPDVIVTGCKARFVRVNWQSLHLEGSQRDYRLSLRLGRSIDHGAIQAEMNHGVLTVMLPKRAGHQAGVAKLRRVA